MQKFVNYGTMPVVKKFIVSSSNNIYSNTPFYASNNAASMGGDLASNLGGPKFFFADQFQEKLVIDLVLRIFPFFSHIFRMFTMLNVVYDHFLIRKPPFFTLFI